VAVVSTVAAASLTSGGVVATGFTHAFVFSAVAAALAALVSLVLVPAGRPPAGASARLH
jgi:hypothetical protein